MKKIGLFLLKNNIHIMTLIFIGFAVWAGAASQCVGKTRAAGHDDVLKLVHTQLDLQLIRSQVGGFITVGTGKANYFALSANCAEFILKIMAGCRDRFTLDNYCTAKLANFITGIAIFLACWF